MGLDHSFRLSGRHTGRRNLRRQQQSLASPFESFLEGPPDDRPNVPWILSPRPFSEKKQRNVQIRDRACIRSETLLKGTCSADHRTYRRLDSPGASACMVRHSAFAWVASSASSLETACISSASMTA